MYRVGVLHGGVQHGLDDKTIPPGQRLRIARYNEMGGYSSTAVSDAGGSDNEGILG